MEFDNVGYKYREIGEDGTKERARLYEILVENKVYFPKPSSLNDPFDCNPVANFNNPVELRRYVEKKYRSDFNYKPTSKEVTQTVVDMSALYTEYDVRKVFDEYIGVLCLSKCNKLNLMWSHYANSHKGICLGFDLGVIKNWLCKPVLYSSERVNIDLMRIKEDESYRKDIISSAVFTKGEDWCVEKEIRSLSKNPGHQEYSPAGLKSITFGLATSEKDRDYVLSLIKEAGIEPLILECWQTNLEHNLFVRDYVPTKQCTGKADECDTI